MVRVCVALGCVCVVSLRSCVHATVTAACRSRGIVIFITCSLKLALLQISWFSIVLTIGTGIAGIVIFITSSSPAMLGYGLESFVDVFSSIVVVWRFSLDSKDCDNDGIEGSKQAMVYAAEKKAGMLIAFTFVAIGIVVSTEATYSLCVCSCWQHSIFLLFLVGHFPPHLLLLTAR